MFFSQIQPAFAEESIAIESIAQEVDSLDSNIILTDDIDTVEDEEISITDDEPEDIVIEDSLISPPNSGDSTEDLPSNYDNAQLLQGLRDMNIKALDGAQYHISDFNEDYIAVFFGRSYCGNTNSMVKTAAGVRDSGRSVKIILMDIEASDSGLADMASKYSITASLNSPYNSNLMFKLYSYVTGVYGGSVTLPCAFVLNPAREIVYANCGCNTNELKGILSGKSHSVDTYPFDISYTQQDARDILPMVNSFRTGSEAWAWDENDSEKIYYNNLGTLTYDYGLEKVAMQRAAEIAVLYDHTRPNGDPCFSAYTDQSGAMGENIAYGYLSSESMFKGWKEDNESYYYQGHRRNMLSSSFNYIGMACAIVGNRRFWVQEFSSVPTDLSYTSPASDTRTVNVDIDSFNIEDKLIESSQTELDLFEEETVSLPEVREYLKVTGSSFSRNALAHKDPAWSGYNNKLIKIDTSKQTVTGLSSGSTDLTATLDGMSTTIKVSVTKKPTVDKIVAIKYNSSEDAKNGKNGTQLEMGSTLYIDYGQKVYLLGKALPLPGVSNFDASTKVTASGDCFTYNSKTGELTSKNVGTGSLTFVSNCDPTVTGTINVTINEVSIDDIYFEKDEITLGTGDSASVKLKSSPDITSQKFDDVIWSSSDSGIASVKGSGKDAVISTGSKTGTAVITAKMGRLSASLNVNVKTILAFKYKDITLVSKPGSTKTLEVDLEESLYKKENLIWTSSDTKVVTVKNGVVTANENLDDVKTAKITVSTPDKKYKDTCTVTVTVAGKADAPTASVNSGEIEEGTKLLLTSSTVDSVIFYTTDGTNPSVSSAGKPQNTATKQYSDAITLDNSIAKNGTVTIKAVATCNEFKNSSVVTFTYKIKQDWGDLASDAEVKKLFKSTSEIPEGIWYVIGGKLVQPGTLQNFTRTYTGSKITFDEEIKIFNHTSRLWENRDYTLTYANNLKAADAGSAKAPSVTVTGMGMYSQKVKFLFGITPESITKATMTSEKTVAVSPNTKLSSVKPILTYDGTKLTINKAYTLAYRDNTGAEVSGSTAAAQGSSYEITILGKENFSGTYKTKITIKVLDSADKNLVKMSKVKVTVPKAKDLPYTKNGYKLRDLFDNSNSKEAPATVKYNGQVLTYGTDFTVDNLTLKNVGKNSIVIHGTGKASVDGSYSFIGDKTATVTISGIAASNVKVTGLSKTVEYTASPYKLSSEVKLLSGEDVLVNGQDYDVQMNSRSSIGKVSIRFVLKGKYSGKINKSVTIKKKNLQTALVNVSSATYSKAGAIPTVNVTIDGRTLKEGTDYTLSYKNNRKVADKSLETGAPTVVVKGIGNYSGTASAKFTVKKANFKDQVSLVAADVAYKPNGKPGYFKSVPKIMADGKVLTPGVEIDNIDIKSSVTYLYASSDEEIPDSATPDINSLVKIKLTVTCGENSPYNAGTFELSGYYKVIGNGKDLKNATVKIKNPGSFSYNNGREIIPLKEKDLIVTINKKPLGSNDYKIVSVKNNRFLGTATAVIQGTGEYGGSKTFTFKISAKRLK